MDSAPVPSSRRVRVLFICPNLRGGGAERVIVMLANRLDRARFEVSLAVVDMSGAVYRDKVCEGVSVIDLGRSRVRYALPRLVALIRARRPDLVLSTVGHLNLAIASVRGLVPRRTRLIARETSVVSRNLAGEAHPWFWGFLYKRVYPRLDHVICQSRDMHDDLTSVFAFPASRASIVGNPVDIRAIRRFVEDVQPVNRTVSTGTCRLVAAGRLSPEKGFDILIEALALCRDSTLRLTIIGDGPEANRLKEVARARGVAAQIEFRGFVTDPYRLFAAADAFVLSSRFDGFPNVVLEALACGTPVIACPAPGGTADIIRSIPECELAESVSPEALSEAICRWRARQPGRVSADVVNQYDVDVIAHQYEQIFLRVVEP